MGRPQARANPAADRRRRELAVIHVGKKALGLDDDTYRDMLEGLTKKRSAADLDIYERERVITEMRRRGFKPRLRQGSGGQAHRSAKGGLPPRSRGAAQGGPPQAIKIRKLWETLYYLGAVRSLGEAAIDAFTKRQVGVEALAWLDSRQANSVIEALKDWCGRIGFTVPDTRKDGGAEAKRQLLARLWARLYAIGAVRRADDDALNGWLSTHIAPHKTGLSNLDPSYLDYAVEKLGQWHRSALAKIAKTDPSAEALAKADD